MQLKGQNILIIEDEFLIALDLEDTLKEAGAKIIGPAGSNAEAINLLESAAISAAILDLNLADGLSLQVAEKLTRDEVPFVYHTGQTEFLKSAQWPAAPIVNKPSNPMFLIKAISDLLDI